MIVEIESIHGGPDGQRMIFYRVEDAGIVWNYGPIITTDPAFDPVAHKTVIAAKMAEQIALAEFDALVGA